MRLASLAAILILMAVLAGCSSPKPAPQVPASAAERADLWAFDASGAIPQARLAPEVRNWTVAWRSVDGRDAREPTVAVAADGAIFYAARDYSGGAGIPTAGTETPVMRSKDGGLTWTEVSGKLPTGDRDPPTSSDPMIYMDPWTQRLFQIEQVQTDCHWLVWSDDQGATWASNPKVCVLPVADHQAIAAGPSKVDPPFQTYPDVVYVCTNQLSLGSGCMRSYDGGLTFATQTYAYPAVDQETCGGVNGGGLHGHVLVGPEGTVYLPREYCGAAYVAVSQDDGLTWTRHDVDQGRGSVGDPNMAFDADGTVYYLFQGEDDLLYLSYSKDQGASWSTPVLASPPGFTVSNLGAIAAGAPGRIGYAFVGIRQPLPKDGADASAWDNITTDAFVGVGLDATNETPTFAVIKANPDGDPIYRGQCTAGRCGLMRDFIDATIAPDGSFYAAFVDACLRPDEPRAHANTGDCNAKPDDYGEGNGNLGYVTRFLSGPDLGYPWATSN